MILLKASIKVEYIFPKSRKILALGLTCPVQRNYKTFPRYTEYITYKVLCFTRKEEAEGRSCRTDTALKAAQVSMVTIFGLWQTGPGFTDKLSVRNMVHMDLQNLHKIQKFLREGVSF